MHATEPLTTHRIKMNSINCVLSGLNISVCFMIAAMACVLFFFPLHWPNKYIYAFTFSSSITLNCDIIIICFFFRVSCVSIQNGFNQLKSITSEKIDFNSLNDCWIALLWILDRHYHIISEELVYLMSVKVFSRFFFF